MADAALWGLAEVTQQPWGVTAGLHSVTATDWVAFDLYAVWEERTTVEGWRQRVQEVVAEVDATPLDVRAEAHRAWWSAFHARSHISIPRLPSPHPPSLAYNLTQLLLLQRVQDAMQGYSAYPIHFNGQAWNIGSYADSPQGPDHRQWGSAYWWQNVRESYYPAAPSGDLDLLASMFGFYQRLQHVQETRVRRYYNHTGTYYDETMSVLGLVANGGFGFQCEGTLEVHNNPWIRYHWDGSFELCLLMLQYWRFTGDDTFVTATLLPVCSGVMDFFYQHFPERDADGHTVFFPSQSLETWQCNDPTARSVCPTNSIIYVAGLQATLQSLLTLPSPLLPDDLRATFTQQLSLLPPLPTGPCPSNLSLPCLLPASAGWSPGATNNSENVELYTVWPYSLYTLLSPSPNYSLILNNYHTRPYPCNDGWCQDVVDAALLGLRDDAAAMVMDRAQTQPAQGWRFPTFDGPMQDSTPAEDHFSVMRTAVNAMLLQEVGAGMGGVGVGVGSVGGEGLGEGVDVAELRRRLRRDVVVLNEVGAKGEGKRQVRAGEQVGQQRPVLLLFAAWPVGWDVDFQLWASGPTVVSAQCVNDTLTQLTVTPPERKADVVLLGCTTRPGSVWEHGWEAMLLDAHVEAGKSLQVESS